MSIVERKERQRAERYGLILARARELAEAEGWDAVTTRRLAALIDYSQPVLYSHFKGKTEIMAAVATQGFDELAARLDAATENTTGESEGLRKVCSAYLEFARSRPVVYEAMFVLRRSFNSPAKRRHRRFALPSPHSSRRLGQNDKRQCSWPK